MFPLHGTDVGCLGLVCVTCFSLAAETSVRGSLKQALRAWWVDPAVATLGFAFSIRFFDRRERELGCSPRKLMSAGSVFTLFAALSLYWLGVFVWVSAVPPPRAIPDGIPTTPASVAYLMVEVVSGVFAYDFVFYFIHLSLHSMTMGLGIHAVHHSKTTSLRARDVLLHSPLDGTLQVLVNILVQRHTLWGCAKSRLARAIHNIVVTWMLTESHTASLTPRIARHVCVGVSRHRSHHTSCSPYYQQFFGYLDDARLAVSANENDNFAKWSNWLHHFVKHVGPQS